MAKYVPVVIRLEKDASNKATLLAIDNDIKKLESGQKFRPIKLQVDVTDLQKNLARTQQAQAAIELAQLKHTQKLAEIQAAAAARQAQISQSGQNQIATVQARAQAQQASQAQRHADRLAQAAQKSADQLNTIEAKKISQLAVLEVRRRVQAERSAQRLAEIDAQGRNRRPTIGQRLQELGTAATFTGGVGGGALVATAVQSAIAIDAEVNRLTALEGTLGKAQERLRQLRELAQTSIGLTQKGVIQAFTFVKSIGSISDTVSTKLISSIGRLNAAFSIDDVNLFIRNLTQIFTQSFERADIKEAIGRVPIFEQLLERAFGTKDGAKLRQLKEAGKLTLDSFLSGFADAINTDPRLANIGESIATRIQKTQDRIATALAPLGKAILDAIEPAVATAVPIIEKFSKAFEELSPATKLAILSLVSFVVGIGPVLIVIGTVIESIQNLIAVFKLLQSGTAITGVISAVTALNPIVLGLIAVLGAAAIAYATYESAADKAAKVTVEAIEAQSAALKQAKETAGLAGGLTDAIANSAVEHEKFEAVLRRLDPSTRAFIESLKDEKKQLEEVNKEVTSAVENAKGVLEATFRTVAAGFAQNSSDIETQKQTIVDAQKEINDALNSGTTSLLKLLPSLSRGYTTELSQGIVEAKGKLKEFEQAAKSNQDKLILVADQLKLGRDQFIALASSVIGNEKVVKELTATFDRYKQTQESAGNSTDATTGKVDAQAAAMKRLKDAVDNLDVKTAGDEIKARIEDIAKKAKTTAEATKLLKEARSQKDDGGRKVFDEAVKQQEQFLKNKKVLEDQINPSKRSGGGGGKKSDVQQLAEDLKEVNKQTAILRNVSSREFSLRLKVKDARELQSTLEQIIGLRRDLNLPLEVPLPTNIEDAKSLAERLSLLKNLRDQVAEANREVDRLRDVDSEVFRLRLQVEGLRDLERALQQIVSLRVELGEPVKASLPSTLKEADREIERLNALKDALNRLKTTKPVELFKEVKANEIKESNDQFKRLYDTIISKGETAKEATAQQAVATAILSGEYDKLSDAQKQLLKDTAQQIDAQNAYNKQVEQTREQLNRLNDAVVGVFEDLFERGPKAFFDSTLSLIKRSIARIAAELTGSVVTGLLGRLFGLNIGAAGGTSQGVAGATGGLSGALNSILFGGRQASRTTSLPAGTTPPIAGGSIPGLGGGGDIGGLGGGLIGNVLQRIPGLRNIFGTNAAQAAGAAGGRATTAAAKNSLGFLGSLGASGLLLGGGLLGGLVGGKSTLGQFAGNIGGTLALGALGATGIFGSGVAAALPAFFSNPITAIVGGALLGGSFLFGLFADRTLNKFRNEVKKAYQIKVAKDQRGRELFKESEQIGRQAFGKAWKDRMPEVVRLDSVKELIAAYGIATNQENSPLVREFKLRSELADPNDPRNQVIVRRAFGGLVPGPDLRRDTVPALLRGLEFVSTPEVVRREGVGRFEALQANRASIVTDSDISFVRQSQTFAPRPSVRPPRPTAKSTAVSQAPSQTQQENNGQSTTDKLLQVLIEMIGHFGQVMEKFEASPADAVLAKAIKRNPDAVAEGVATSFRARSTASNEIRNLVYSR